MTSRYAAQRDVATPVDRTLFDGVLRENDGDLPRSDALLAVSTVQAHAAMLARLPNGDLGLVWFGGTQEGVDDISIWFARLPEGERIWSTPRQVTDDPTRSEQNPVLFSTPGGRLWLLYTSQTGGNQDTAQVHRRISDDNGLTWSAAEVLFDATDEGGVFIRQPVVISRSGRWLLPIFQCVREEGRRWVGDYDTSAVMLSDDEGLSWRRVSVPDSLGAVHMSIVERPDGSLNALYRSRWADRIHRSVSTDDGQSWTVPVPIALPNNNSSLQHAGLADGDLVLVYNHSSRDDADGQRASLYDEIDDDGLVEPASAPVLAAELDGDHRRAFWGAPRAPMSLAVSTDGEDWTVVADLAQGDGYCLTNNSKDLRNREFSYPVVLPNADGSIDIAYTLHRQTITHVRLASGWRRANG
ncbi:sialidase family protein [Microbacterium sp. A8/3-1]|uniref:Sialidase family protein n=1 Tax=Microbacterium sp. A8/3-1 TaxID=3160749 RepID=A0AAU7W3F8_9MICO